MKDAERAQIEEQYRKREQQLLGEVKEKELELEHFIAKQYQPLQEKLKELIDKDELKQNQENAEMQKTRTVHDQEITKLKLFIMTQQNELEQLRRQVGAGVPG